MKKIFPLIILLIISTTTSAQLFKKRNKSVEPQYQMGMVPTDSLNRVSFTEVIEAEGLSAEQIKERVVAWFGNRYVEPKIIGKKIYDNPSANLFTAKAEEYIVFKNKFFVLDRSRIDYFLNIKCEEGRCIFNMSRITYWYDDEDPKGGLHMKAEDWITDENAFTKNKKSLQRFEGKFRRKTIDLKNALVNELKNELNKPE